MYRSHLLAAFLCLGLLLSPSINVRCQQRTDSQLPVSQSTKSGISDKLYLPDVLNELAKTYHVIFNYDTDLLLNKATTLGINLNPGQNLDRILKKLLAPYHIKFKRSKFIYILYQENTPVIPQTNAGNRQASLTPNKPNSSPQEKTEWHLRGKIVSTTGEILPGVTVLLKNTTTGTTTAPNGEFSLLIPPQAGSLIISSIGYVSQEFSFDKETVIAVNLEEDTKLLNEVVVTGYSTENRSEVTGAVSTVKPAQLQIVPSANVEQQLQGRVAGLTVISNGQPGTSNQIRIRGFGSFGGNQPLYVVDGMPTQNIQFINPNDIETTTVLKDAASASIYGARAAAGVIVLTTKKGQRKAQKLSISYDGLYGVTDPGKGPAILNPQEQADWTWQARRNDLFQTGGVNGPNSFAGIANGQYGSGQTPVLPDYLLVGSKAGVSAAAVDLADEQLKYNTNPTNGDIYLVIPANKSGTDWYKAITRVAPLTRHTLGFSGGTETSRYYLSLGMQQQAGIVINNNFSRYSFRINTEFGITKKLRFGETIQFTYISATGLQGSVGNPLGNSTNNNSSVASDENDILTALRMAPIIPVYNSFGGYAGTAAPGFSNPRNPVANRAIHAHDLNATLHVLGNAYLEYDLIPALTVRSSLGGTYFSNYTTSYSRATYENSENIANYTYTEGSGYGLAWTFTNTAQYKQTVGKHEISALAGIEALNTGIVRTINGSGLNPFSTDPNYITLSTTTAGTTRQVNSTLNRGNAFYSLFGQARYSYQSKYIVTAVVRRDGSSQFGPHYRYGVFPAFSAAWRLSSEAFMKSLPWVSDLKIRGGYGQMGNTNYLSSTNQYDLFASNAANGYDLGATNSIIASGYYTSQIGNPDAKWETSITSTIGLDGAFFNNRLEVVLDFWRKDTKDLLYQLALPSVVGVRASAPFVNVASMRNQGIDLQLTTRGKLGIGLGYELTAIGSFLNNQIMAIAPQVPYFTSGGTRLGTPVVRNEPGHALSSFYGYRVMGLFTNKEEVAAAAIQTGAAPGRFRFADINGDGKIDDNDRTYLGSPIPKFTGSLNLSLTYKGIDLSANLYTSLGSQIFNNQRWFTDFYPSFTGAAVSARVKDSWLPTHTNTSVPIFESAANFSTNTQSNSYYVENGSYARLQYISMGYTFPSDLIKRLTISRLRVYVSATNLFTITRYSGLDPAVGGLADATFGIDVGNYPVTRGYTVGVSFGF
ncbi:SusC/RagA family TonB-linked outer membrane protein [Spirosoma sp. HMF4905]|uniref:SusC/RagA family TonB-linked outer membrane protein n=1 Tax=Spirosoma arboris TaxID=2682092 RepID=A0A7K1SCL3_9BACT|nr:SusC/RagA family TonB-linked outer membrane protein [Spirosoma arboris]MVM31408.1 SusC/RagA family TonB-linked outer membrane protein [Spirosoma arboris]